MAINISHSELQKLFSDYMSQNIRDGINVFFEQDLDNPSYYYLTDSIWDLDSTLDGIGGYCMPANPVQNPFPSGELREIYRPLQYARSSIDITDVRIFARNVVENAGMHLEAACRKYLHEKLPLGKLRYDNSTLGKAVQTISQMNEFDKEMIDALFLFVAVYNRSKHEINQDINRKRMFNASDAIVSYFAVRVLGIEILRKTSSLEVKNRYKLIPAKPFEI